ncbi:MAG: hypothetical protein JEZ07_12485 [Phycisphaerae bacterium]|nr:hypothetical protein [Phycisphaerae bacterium]
MNKHFIKCQNNRIIMKIQANHILSLLISLGLFLLTIIFLKGNWLVLAGPLSLWIFVFIISDEKYNKITFRKILITIAIWFFALSIWVPKIIASVVADREISECIDEINALLGNKQYAEVMLKWESLHIPEHMLSQNAEKYHNLGVLYLSSGQIDNAYEALRKAINYDPLNAEAFFYLACIGYEKGKYNQSAEHLIVAKELGYQSQGMAKLEKDLLKKLSNNN